MSWVSKTQKVENNLREAWTASDDLPDHLTWYPTISKGTPPPERLTKDRSSVRTQRAVSEAMWKFTVGWEPQWEWGGETTGRIHIPQQRGTGGTFLVVQGPKLHAPNAGGPGSTPSQGTRSHMPPLKGPHAITKTWCSQINLKNKKRRTRESWHGRCGWLQSF